MPAFGLYGSSLLSKDLQYITALQQQFSIIVLDSPPLHQQLQQHNIPHEHVPLHSPEKQTFAMIMISTPVPEWNNERVLFLQFHAFQYKTTLFLTTSSQLEQVRTHGMDSISRVQAAKSVFQLLIEANQQVMRELSDLSMLQNVLVVGNGGREHSLAWKLAQSKHVGHVYVAPGNGGTNDTLNPIISNIDIAVTDQQGLVTFAKEKQIGLCVIGPEAPLIDGLVDKMAEEGIKAFGPNTKAAQLEASKAFSKAFMERHAIPTAKFQCFTEFSKAKEYIESIDFDIVVKASGIAAGKGVILPEDTVEAIVALEDIMVKKSFGAAGEEVVIEELLSGEEVSVLAFCDGTNTVTMPGAQDHKRIYDCDEGPNTGGMGAYAPAPCLSPELKAETDKIVQDVVNAMANEQMPYVGILYAGFMLTPNGPKVLEFNCRFGDPETQVLLPLLDSDLFDIMLSCVDRKLSPSQVRWKSGSVATVVMASQGYPGSYPKGKTIAGINLANNLEGVQTFHAGTKVTEDKEVKTNGGRVLAVSAWGDTLQDAVEKSYNGISKINFHGAQFRKDIAVRGLLHDAPTTKLAVLGSTRGSSMQPIIDAIECGSINATIQVVITNKADAGIIDRAKRHGIEVIVLSSKGKKRETFDQEVSQVLLAKKIDLVLLIGYMRILSASFCKEWKDRVLNVHPSLLPDFAGGMDLAVHQAVLDANRDKSGCTVHFVTEAVDGGPIAVQLSCPVKPTDTAESLKARVQPLEGKAFLQAIRLFQTGRLIPIPQQKSITYADAGVSIDAGNALVEAIKPLCKSTRRKGCDSDLGGFGGLFDLSAAGYTSDTVLVACTDGVGTKLKIAQLYGKHDTVGIDLVAMCVNDLIVQGAEPLLFLDYYACGSLEVDAAADVVKGIADGCRQSNCGLIGGETAEMPSMYSSGEYDLAGFCIGAVKKTDLLPLPIAFNDCLIGLPSSGLHSNGFSLVRKLVDMHHYKYTDPCPFQSDTTLGNVLLAPTRIYVKQLLPLIHQKLISALAHITGGGLLENVPRILPDDKAVEIDCTAWQLPPVFQWIQTLGNLSNHEMSRTFNCGIGMVLIVSPPNVSKVMEMLQALNEIPVILGKVIPKTTSDQVILHGTMQ